RGYREPVVYPPGHDPEAAHDPRVVDLQRDRPGRVRALRRDPQDPAQEAAHPPLHARAGGAGLPALRHPDDRQGGIRPMKTRDLRELDRREFLTTVAAGMVVAGLAGRPSAAFAQAAGKTLKPSATDVLLVIDVQNCFEREAVGEQLLE